MLYLVLFTDDLMEERPGVKDPGVSNNKWNAEPIDQVDCVVVVEIVPDVFEFDVAIVIVGMHGVGDWLSEFRVDLLEDGSRVGRLLETEEHKNAHVDQAESHDTSPKGFIRTHEGALETLENTFRDEHEERAKETSLVIRFGDFRFLCCKVYDDTEHNREKDLFCVLHVGLVLLIKLQENI